jgi:two-component system cell cycle response regulator
MSTSSSLVHAALAIRKTARLAFGFGAAASFAALVLLGVFRTPLEALGLEHGLVFGAWLAIFATRARKYMRERSGSDAGRTLDLELGLLLLVLAHAAVQLGGGLDGPFYPLVYVLVAFLASFARSPMGTLLVLCAIGLEAAITLWTEPEPSYERFALHGAFIVLFGALNVVFTRAEIARVRERSKKELDDERAKVREDARLFRLASASSSDQRDEEKVFRSSLDEVRDALYHALDLLKRTLDLHTCILLMKEESGRLAIVELATDSDDVAEGPFGAGEGAVGAVASRGLVMNLENLKAGYKGLCYYRGGALVKSFLGVPVHEHGQLRGALCADRLADRPFTPQEEEIVKAAIAQVLRAIQNERVFVQLERAKSEQGHLYRASQALGGALSEEQVIDAGLAAAGDIAAYDFAAITLYDFSKRTHRVRKAVGEGAAAFASLTFRDNTSLTAMAVKNRHYLPYRGEFDPRQQVVFTRRANLEGMRSLLILPLVVREDAIGALALAAHRPDAFHEGVRPTLSVLANQLAVALSNAAAVKRLEEMATTDGLTGCLNKRAFLEELDAKLRSAERFGRKLSLLVTDLDHFKSVNDTYGHDVGDVVIKGLGTILMKVKRDTDSVARFGGEEFCVLCEETDTPGAVKLGERVREELGATVFQTELGKLGITCSIGVATFPNDARTPAELFKAADLALYAAKHGGRDRVCTTKNT